MSVMLSCVVNEEKEVGEETALKAGVIVFQALPRKVGCAYYVIRDPESCTCLPSASDQSFCDWRLRVQTQSPISIIPRDSRMIKVPVIGYISSSCCQCQVS